MSPLTLHRLEQTPGVLMADTHQIAEQAVAADQDVSEEEVSEEKYDNEGLSTYARKRAEGKFLFVTCSIDVPRLLYIVQRKLQM